MIYSEVVNAGFILPRKVLYTMKDVDKVLVGGLFNKSGTFSIDESLFIVMCSAMYNNTDYSKTIRDYSKKNKIYTRVTKSESL